MKGRLWISAPLTLNISLIVFGKRLWQMFFFQFELSWRNGNMDPNTPRTTSSQLSEPWTSSASNPGELQCFRLKPQLTFLCLIVSMLLSLANTGQPASLTPPPSSSSQRLGAAPEDPEAQPPWRHGGFHRVPALRCGGQVRVKHSVLNPKTSLSPSNYVVFSET